MRRGASWGSALLLSESERWLGGGTGNGTWLASPTTVEGDGLAPTGVTDDTTAGRDGTTVGWLCRVVGCVVAASWPSCRAPLAGGWGGTASRVVVAAVVVMMAACEDTMACGGTAPGREAPIRMGETSVTRG